MKQIDLLVAAAKNDRTNCTLLNWNLLERLIEIFTDKELIVHYWIETNNSSRKETCNSWELIVHYWIETGRRDFLPVIIDGTNCTLLNWNFVMQSAVAVLLRELIVHYWIETPKTELHYICSITELIVHYWIETSCVFFISGR